MRERNKLGEGGEEYIEEGGVPIGGGCRWSSLRRLGHGVQTGGDRGGSRRVVPGEAGRRRRPQAGELGLLDREGHGKSGVIVLCSPASSGEAEGIHGRVGMLERWSGGSVGLEVSVVAGWCEGDPEEDLVEWRRRRDGRRECVPQWLGFGRCPSSPSGDDTGAAGAILASVFSHSSIKIRSTSLYMCRNMRLNCSIYLKVWMLTYMYVVTPRFLPEFHLDSL